MFYLISWYIISLIRARAHPYLVHTYAYSAQSYEESMRYANFRLHFTEKGAERFLPRMDIFTNFTRLCSPLAEAAVTLHSSLKMRESKLLIFNF